MWFPGFKNLAFKWVNLCRYAEGVKDPTVKCWGDEEEDDGDPPRLWVQNGMYPGTAFTRSIGDAVGLYKFSY
jgi:hypothetical protein